MYKTEQTNIDYYIQGNSFFNYLRSVNTIFKRQLYRLISSKTQVIFMLLMPLMWLVIIGQTFNSFLGGGPTGSLFPNGMDYLTFMTPGILIMVTLFTGIFGGIALFYDRDSGYLKTYLISPIPRTAILVGYSLGTGARVFIQVTLLLVIGVFLGADIDLSLQSLLIVYTFAMLTTFFLMGLAITLASKAPNVEVFQTMIMPIAMPLQFLSPVMYPIAFMPDYFQWIAKINPITFGVDGLRGSLFGKAFTTPFISDVAFIADNIVIFDLLFLLLVGVFLLFTGSRMFLRSLEG